MKYIGGFRQVSTRPSTDTNQSAATGMQLDVPSNTQQAPSHVDEELPAVQQQYTAEAPQLNGPKMFLKRDPPVHESQQARHNTAVWQSFQTRLTNIVEAAGGQVVRVDS